MVSRAFPFSFGVVSKGSNSVQVVKEVREGGAWTRGHGIGKEERGRAKVINNDNILQIRAEGQRKRERKTRFIPRAVVHLQRFLWERSLRRER